MRCPPSADARYRAPKPFTKSLTMRSPHVVCRISHTITAVPTLVVADADGVVRASFLGPVTATDLWAAVAELREPGSVPPGCADH